MEWFLLKGMCRDYGSIKDKQRSQPGKDMKNFSEVGVSVIAFITL